MNISVYPWFGGKSTIMPVVWKRLGDTPNFVDPFLGSNAPLLSRPGWDWETGQWTDGRNRIETVNDKDCFVANFWRALDADPAAVAYWADWPVNEADLHARHLWLVNNESFIERMKSDPDYYDVKVAGWWGWGLCQWIAGGWCSKLDKRRPHLGNAGQGICRPNQQIPHLGNAGQGTNRKQQNMSSYLKTISARLRGVRVCCGDWTRVLGPTPTFHNGLTAILLDPPYNDRAKRTSQIYAEDSLSISNDVREWAITNGDNPKLRIALFGYEDEHSQAMPGDWEMLAWKANGGYSNRNVNGNDNPHKERIWFSPHCLKFDKVEQLSFKGLGCST